MSSQARKPCPAINVAAWRKTPCVPNLRDSACPLLDGTQTLPKGLMGVPSPFLDVALLDENDMPVQHGEIGQLAFRPRFPGLLLKEYLRKPETTLKAFRNLWFHTGDACRAIDEGRYVFVDRLGGYFRVRGENVSSFEVESLMASHPKVRAVAAVPIPARVGSEDEIAAFVEPMAGESLTEADLRELRHAADAEIHGAELHPHRRSLACHADEQSGKIQTETGAARRVGGATGSRYTPSLKIAGLCRSTQPAELRSGVGGFY